MNISRPVDLLESLGAINFERFWGGVYGMNR